MLISFEDEKSLVLDTPCGDTFSIDDYVMSTLDQVSAT